MDKRRAIQIMAKSAKLYYLNLEDQKILFLYGVPAEVEKQLNIEEERLLVGESEIQSLLKHKQQDFAQTDILIFLLQYAWQRGDKEKYAKLLKGARLRRAVDYEKVQNQLGP